MLTFHPKLKIFCCLFLALYITDEDYTFSFDLTYLIRKDKAGLSGPSLPLCLTASVSFLPDMYQLKSKLESKEPQLNFLRLCRGHCQSFVSEDFTQS